MFERIRELTAIRDSLSAEIAKLEATTLKPTLTQRVISRSAQTVEPGMLVEFPWGWEYCNGVSYTTPHCVLSGPSGKLWTKHCKDRVRTKRGLVVT